MRSSILGLSALALCALATPAMAQEANETDPPEGPVTVSASVAVVTDYRFRGISFSDEGFAVQPSLTVNHESGLYVSLWGSNLDDTPTFGEVEVDLIAGYSTEVSPGATLDVGMVYYYYPDGTGNSDYFEPYASIRGELGPATVKVGANYAWDQAAIANADNLYVYSDASVALPESPVTAVAHVGYSDGSLAPGGSYWDWSAGLDFAAGPLTLGIRYVDTDLDDLTGVPAADTLYDETVLFSLTLGF